VTEEKLPNGWTRETTIRIDRDGRFSHDGAPFAHDRLSKTFAGWLDVDPASGRYILRNAIHWVFVEADDAPLVVTSLRVDGDRVELALSDETTEPLAVETLRIDEDDVPYADVRGGKLPARFSRPAAFALGEWLEGKSPPKRVARGEGARQG
jgi:uncharacterized protein